MKLKDLCKYLNFESFSTSDIFL